MCVYVYFVNVFACLYIYVRRVVNVCVCSPVYMYACLSVPMFFFFVFFYVYNVFVGVCAHLQALIRVSWCV